MQLKNSAKYKKYRTKYKNNKKLDLRWFSRLIRHSARKRDGLRPIQYNAPEHTRGIREDSCSWQRGKRAILNGWRDGWSFHNETTWASAMYVLTCPYLGSWGCNERN